MNIDVLRRLTHTITLQPVIGLDETGTPAWDTSGPGQGGEWVSGQWIEGSDEEPPLGGTVVECFIQPVARRILGPNNRVILTDWDVLVMGTVVVGPGDRVVSGTTNGGVMILPSGIVEAVDDSYHPKDVRKMRVLSVRSTVQ